MNWPMLTLQPINLYNFPGATQMSDMINHPSHYTDNGSGVECIQVSELMSFSIGNAIKYIWRCDGKGKGEDIKKAAWYINHEIARIKAKKYTPIAVEAPPGVDYIHVASHLNPLVAHAFIYLFRYSFFRGYQDIKQLEYAIASLDGYLLARSC